MKKKIQSMQASIRSLVLFRDSVEHQPNVFNETELANIKRTLQDFARLLFVYRKRAEISGYEEAFTFFDTAMKYFPLDGSENEPTIILQYVENTFGSRRSEYPKKIDSYFREEEAAEATGLIWVLEAYCDLYDLLQSQGMRFDEIGEALYSMHKSFVMVYELEPEKARTVLQRHPLAAAFLRPLFASKSDFYWSKDDWKPFYTKQRNALRSGRNIEATIRKLAHYTAIMRRQLSVQEQDVYEEARKYAVNKLEIVSKDIGRTPEETQLITAFLAEPLR